MRRLFVFSLLLCMMLATLPSVALSADELPLPRFVSLRSNEANLRVGPGTRYPIHWVYQRRGMPVEIIEEYGNWRKIRDMEGTEGWLHHGLLSGKRTALVSGTERPLRRNPDAGAPIILKAKPMVIGALLRCSRHWCHVEISGYKGWMEKSSLWGVYPKEQF